MGSSSISGDGIQDRHRHGDSSPAAEWAARHSHIALEAAAEPAVEKIGDGGLSSGSGNTKRQRQVTSADTQYSTVSSSGTPLLLPSTQQRSTAAESAADSRSDVFETSATATPAVATVARTEVYDGGECLTLDDGVDASAVVMQLPDPQQRRFSDDSSTVFDHRLITAEVLRDWTGWERLDAVVATQLRFDAEEMIGVDQIGQQLPRLTSLKLHGSRIPRLRYLGTGFHALRYLWLNGCHVQDLRGIAACSPSLVELYLSFNAVTDIRPLADLSATLEVLDLEGNMLSSTAALEATLPALHQLRGISLQGNPLTCEGREAVVQAAAALAGIDYPEGGKSSTDDIKSRPFREILVRWILYLMPQLQILDDVAVESGLHRSICGSVTSPSAAAVAATDTEAVSDDRPNGEDEATAAVAESEPLTSSHVDPMDAALALELRFVEDCLRETGCYNPLDAAIDQLNSAVYSRPSTSHGCSSSDMRCRPTTALGAVRPSTAVAMQRCRVGRLGSTAAEQHLSTLTTGDALVGSAIAGLRRRLGAVGSSVNTDDDAASLDGRQKRSSDNSSSASTAASAVSGVDGAAELVDAAAAAVAVRSVGLTEEQRIAALMDDDSEEDEWERLKAKEMEERCCRRASMSMTLSSKFDHFVEGGARLAECSSSAEEDRFTAELKRELCGLRSRIAKAGLS